MKKTGRNYIRFWVVFGLLLCLPSLGYGFTVTAQVGQTRISSQEAVSLQVVVDGGEANIDLGGITDFKVLSSRTSSNRSYMNGKWEHKVVYQYMLMPQKTGVLIIPPLTAVRDGETGITEEIRILVSDAGDTTEKEPDFFAEAQISSSDIVLGQQAVYTLKLLAARQFKGASFDPPGFKGLAARELTEWTKYTKTINGRAFMVNEIKFLVQGETPGDFMISPAIFMARVPVKSARRRDSFDSLFNDSFFDARPTKPVRVVSNQVPLTVSPLPEYKGENVFSGLVGNFTMAAALDKENIKAGESATLTVTIQGVGNIMDAALPPLGLDQDRFKVYEDAPVEDVNVTEKGLAGKKVFKQALVTAIPGSVTIPSLTLTFFDTLTKTYKSVSTQPIPLEVIPGEPITVAGADTPVNAGHSQQTGFGKKTEVTLQNKDILDIREEISSISSVPYLSLYWFLGLVCLPGIGFIATAFLFQFRQREKSLREQYRSKAADQIKAAGKLNPGTPEFLASLQAALNSAVLAWSDKPAESLTRQEVKQILSGTKPGEKTAEQVTAIMDTMDAARFGGQTMDEKTSQDCLEQVRSLIRTLMVVGCLIPVLVFSSPVFVEAQDHEQSQAQAPVMEFKIHDTRDRAGLFVDAVRDYKAGEFQAAAKQFETIASTGVKNPDLFYNTGNAYLKSNNLGRAILWYERAKRLAPGDPDLDFNLAHAQSLVKDKTDKSFSLFDVLFFWQGMISLKWLQFLSIGSSVFFFAWAGIRKFRQKNIFSGFGIVAFVLFSVLTLVVGLEAYRLNSDARAVILDDQVAVRSGTMESATVLFELHEGTRVRVLEKKKSYMKIRFAKGKVGWVSTKEAEII